MHIEGSAMLLMLDLALRHDGHLAQLHMDQNSSVQDSTQLHGGASVTLSACEEMQLNNDCHLYMHRLPEREEQEPGNFEQEWAEDEEAGHRACLPDLVWQAAHHQPGMSVAVTSLDSCTVEHGALH